MPSRTSATIQRRREGRAREEAWGAAPKQDRLTRADAVSPPKEGLGRPPDARKRRVVVLGRSRQAEPGVQAPVAKRREARERDDRALERVAPAIEAGVAAVRGSAPSPATWGPHSIQMAGCALRLGSASAMSVRGHTLRHS